MSSKNCVFIYWLHEHLSNRECRFNVRSRSVSTSAVWQRSTEIINYVSASRTHRKSSDANAVHSFHLMTHLRLSIKSSAGKYWTAKSINNANHISLKIYFNSTMHSTTCKSFLREQSKRAYYNSIMIVDSTPRHFVIRAISIAIVAWFCFQHDSSDWVCWGWRKCAEVLGRKLCFDLILNQLLFMLIHSRHNFVFPFCRQLKCRVSKIIVWPKY